MRCGEPQPFQTRAQRSGSRLRACQKYFFDKLKRSQVQKNIKAIKEGLKLSKDGIIIPFSAETKQGRDEIWALIDELTGLAATEEA